MSDLLVYSIPYTIHIHNIDNDSLLQMFSHYRLQDGDNWHLRHTWRRLAHVCQKWRYLVYYSPSYLDMCLRLTNKSPSMNTLNHLPPLPLIIDYSDTSGIRTLARKYEDNVHIGLLQNGRVRQVTLQAPSSSLRRLLERMNKPYPRLEDLSLSSTTTEETNVTSVVLLESLQLPILNRLSLHGFCLPNLSSMITLSTLSLTHIRDSCYFTPGNLIIQLQGLPHLEELSIGFAIPMPLPSSERDLLPTPIPPVTLPALKRLTFRGMSVYLDNLVAQINAPLLEQLSLTLLFELAFTLVNLAQFIHRTEGLRCLVARVSFNKESASIDAGHYQKWVTGKRGLHVNVTCEPLDWRIDSATQVCSAIGKVLSTVEGLTLDLDVNGMPLDWENTLDSIMWHELLLPFVGVKKLHIGDSLTPELSRSLESVAGGLALELLPELQELEIKSIEGCESFSGFLKTRNSVGRPVYIRDRFSCPLPNCGRTYNRPQDRHRHIRYYHLPHDHYCELEGCNWTGVREVLPNHLKDKHRGIPMPEQEALKTRFNKRFEIYDAKGLVRQLLTNEISLEQALVEVRSLYQNKGVELGKRGWMRGLKATALP